MFPLYTIFGSAGMRWYGIIVYDPLGVLFTWLTQIYLKDAVCGILSLWRRIEATAFLFCFPLESDLLVSSCYCCLVQLMTTFVFLLDDLLVSWNQTCYVAVLDDLLATLNLLSNLSSCWIDLLSLLLSVSGAAAAHF